MSQQQRPGYEPTDTRLWYFVRRIPILQLVLAVAIALVYWVPFWPGELFVSFTPQLLILLWGGFLLCFSLYARFLIRDGLTVFKKTLGVRNIPYLPLSILIGFAVSMHSLHVVPQAKPRTAAQPTLRATTANVLYTNRNNPALLALLEEEQRDVVVLQEVYKEDMDTLGIALGMPHRYISDCQCSAEDSELAIMSHWPLFNRTVVASNDNGIIMRADMAAPRGYVRVYGVHMTVPFTASSFDTRSSMYQALRDDVTGYQEDFFVMGDFNTSAYSPELRKFLKATGLLMAQSRDWPSCSWYGFGSAACLRIDYALVPKRAKIGSHVLGPNIGSDHLPQTVTLNF